MKTIMMSTVAALFAVGAAHAQSDTFVIIDADDDGTITMDEYDAAFQEPNDAFWFDMWDADTDGVLTRDEVLSASWAQYDKDHDSVLSQEEVRAWNEDNNRLNAMRSGREVSGPGGDAAGGDAGSDN